MKQGRFGRLEGKVALITGTGGIMGRGVAEVFAREGATIVGCDINAEGNRQTQELIESRGGRMLAMQVDLTEHRAAVAWIDAAVAEFGGFDILHNNAGLARMTAIDAPDAQEAWSFTVKYELDLVFSTIHAAWPHMVARGGGSIVNISSGAAERGSPVSVGGAAGSSAAHSATKAGIIGMTRQLAAEGARHRIRVNAILPGFTESSATIGSLSDPAERALMNARNPLGRIGTGVDIGEAAAFLASDAASWITAETLVVDGGAQTILGSAVVEKRSA